MDALKCGTSMHLLQEYVTLDRSSLTCINGNVGCYFQQLTKSLEMIDSCFGNCFVYDLEFEALQSYLLP